jgi:hypothetical protein
MVLCAGLRNIIAPGLPIPVIPEDEAFQVHFHGKPGSDPKMALIFQMMGVGLCGLAYTKIVSIFVHNEGTFLRQKLFFGLGMLDFVMAYVVHSYKALPPSVMDGFAAMHAIEGLALLAVAFFKNRPVKPRSTKKGK